jgi:hypothetical protein
MAALSTAEPKLVPLPDYTELLPDEMARRAEGCRN